ncbi:MAG: hypothetical protein JWN70_6570 [Planctomycetaceae bacterium]|nr:hypothetical protein [Planctomycetaceae bacterium]
MVDTCGRKRYRDNPPTVSLDRQMIVSDTPQRTVTFGFRLDGIAERRDGSTDLDAR